MRIVKTVTPRTAPVRAEGRDDADQPRGRPEEAHGFHRGLRLPHERRGQGQARSRLAVPDRARVRARRRRQAPGQGRQRVQERLVLRSRSTTATRPSPTTISLRPSSPSTPRRPPGARSPRATSSRSNGTARASGRTTTRRAPSTTRACSTPARTLGPHESATYRQIAFFGPKERDVLSRAAGGWPRLQDLINLGTFSIVAKVLVEIITWIHAHITAGNWGLAIIVLTIGLRVTLLPAHVEADPERDRDAQAEARDRRPEREVQGRRAGEEPRDDGALAQEQGQPARRLPAGARPDADLVRPLRDAPDRGRVLPRRSSCGFRTSPRPTNTSFCPSSSVPR